MTRLPRISGADCVRALLKAGFRLARQRGSHVTLIRDEPYAMTIVPQHRMVKLGTLRKILRDISMTVEQFSDLL